MSQDSPLQEIFYKAIFDGSVSGMIVADVESQRFVEVNAAICDQLGYSRDELLNFTVSDLFTAEDLPRAIDYFQRSVRKEIGISRNIPLKRKDGSLLYTDVSASHLEIAGRRLIAGTFLDVSEREKILEELQELHLNLDRQINERTNELRLAKEAAEKANSLVSATLEATDNGLLVIGAKGEVTYANKHFFEMWNIAKELSRSFDDKALLAYVLEQLTDPQEFLAKINWLYEHSAESSHDLIYFKDGRIFSRNSHPQYLEENIVGRVWTFLDITQQHQAETNLKNQYSFMSTLLESLPIPVFYKNARGIYEGCNRAYEEFLQKDREEIIGKCVYDMAPREIADRYHEKDLELFDHPGEQIYEWVVKPKDGSTRNVIFHKATYFHADGNVAGLIGAIQDITDKINQIHQIQSIQSELERRISLAESAAKAKSEFLSNMSHEIRTPLNGVLGLLQLLECTSLDKRQADYVGKAFRTTRILLNIINDILDISRIEAGRIDIIAKPFKLQEAIDAVMDTLAGAANQKHLSLIKALDESCPIWLNGDVLRIQQVLLNLGNNAIKFTEQGQIEFRIFCTLAANQSASIRFEIHDTGIGISPTQCERIFERFTQVESGDTRRFGGTGLGLAIAKGLVAAMGGEIGVESELGRGSQFWFVLSLPVVNAPASASASASASNLAGLRILVAEDQEINQLVLMDMLNKLGAQAVLAKDGSDAIAQILAANASQASSGTPASDAPFDAVLMDVQMPVMDGLEATRVLRRERQLTDLPIIAISAGVEATYREQAIVAGMNEFLAKPFYIEDLCRILQRHCLRPERVSPFMKSHVAATPVESTPGFDLAEAIDRLGGDTAMYVRLATRFLDSLDSTHQNLCAVLRDTSVEGTHQAIKELHAFRSGVLTLGATKLADLTRHIESSLSEGREIDRGGMQKALDAAFVQVHKIIQANIERFADGNY